MNWITAGESHGPKLTGIIEGLPSGLAIDAADINRELARRQKGYGRGGRMQIEKDQVQMTAGIRHGKTLGSPVCLTIENKDWESWKDIMDPSLPENYVASRVVDMPRPGHADLVGGIKYNHRDMRNVLERSSARETTTRVALAAICRKLLQELDIYVMGHVYNIGGVSHDISGTSIERLSQADLSPVRCIDDETTQAMIKKIDWAKEKGTSLGGIFEICVFGLPAGIGSYVHWDRKLDAILGKAILSIPAIKGFSVGKAFDFASLPGYAVMDEILWQDGYTRNSNTLGGIEGGMSNGQTLSLHAVMKPIPTQYHPLKSVNINTRQSQMASVERSDHCAVPAASLVGEAMVCIAITEQILDQFESDTMERLKAGIAEYRKYVKEW